MEQGSTPKPRLTSAYVMIAIATLSWGANMVSAKIALAEFSPFAFGPLRIFASGVIFGLFGLRILRRRGNLYRKDGKMFLGLAVTGPVLTHLLFVTGLNLSSPFHAGLIYAVGPLLVLMLSSWFGMERFTFAKITGALVAFSGVALLGLGEAPFNQPNVWVGDLILFCGAISFSVYTIFAKKAAVKYDAMTLNVYSYLIAATLVLPFMGTTVLETNWAGISTAGWAAAGFSLIFGSLVPYLLYYKALERLTAARVAFFSYLEPLIAGSGSALLLHEEVSSQMILAAVLILGGVYLAERRR